MKINVELDENEILILSEAFESAIAERVFYDIEEEDEDDKVEYFKRVQDLVNKLGLEVSVEAVIEELEELNNMPDEFFNDEVNVDKE